MSKTIFLEYTSKRFEVTQEGYQKIREIIEQYQICTGCGNVRDNGEHLFVGKKCLSCVLNAHPSLTFVGFVRFNNDGYAVYAFTNAEGITLLSVENDSSSPQEDIAGSIEDRGFTIPTTYKPFKSTEEVPLYRSSWSFYGSLEQSVIVLHYKDSYHAKKGLYIDFIAYKGGETIELNRRTTAHKNLLEKARNLAERTKKNGLYHLNGETYRELDDTHLYPIISRLESADYNEQLAFLKAQQPEEPQLTLLDVTMQDLSQQMQEDGSQQDSSDHIEEPFDQATITSIEPLATEPENAEVADPAQEIQTEQEEQTEKTKKRGKLHVVKQEPGTDGEPTA